MKKILLADDSITIQKVVELTFSEGDYQVVCVGNGAQALKKVGEIRPDIILLDVIMPEKNGYEVCELIKQDPATSSIPVLLLTGTFEPFDKKKADAVGAQGHLTKPFESQVLIAKVNELIGAVPRLSSAEAGGMDIVSGGSVYHVDAGRAEPGLRAPAAPQGAEDLSAPAEESNAPMAPRPAMPPPPITDEPPEDWSRPAAVPPDPADGGSYVGFADLGSADGDEAEIVPDRFDHAEAAPTSTVRLQRENLFRGDTIGSAQEEGAPDEEGAFALSDEPIEGLTGAFETPAAPAPAAADRSAPEPVWTAPAEAPPAETWQEPADDRRPDPPRSTAPFESLPPPRPAPAGQGGAGTALTPEAIDLIAERVVERLSERVVREIAWEVIPQVAETLVRKRIKELEEDESR